MSDDAIKAEVLDASPSFLEQLAEIQLMEFTPDPSLKDELLATTALHVHDGVTTLIVTFDEEEAEIVAARNNYLPSQKRVAVIDIVEGSMVHKWESWESQRAAMRDYAMLTTGNVFEFHEEKPKSILYGCVVKPPYSPALILPA